MDRLCNSVHHLNRLENVLALGLNVCCLLFSVGTQHSGNDEQSFRNAWHVIMWEYHKTQSCSPLIMFLAMQGNMRRAFFHDALSACTCTTEVSKLHCPSPVKVWLYMSIRHSVSSAEHTSLPAIMNP